VNRALGTVSALLVGCLLLPTVAGYAAQAVPVLVSLLVLLGFLRLLLPPRSGRRS
jgi:hypothetical protein